MIDMSRLEPLICNLPEYDQHQVENLVLEMIWERSEADFAILDALIKTMHEINSIRKADEEFNLIIHDLEAHREQARKTYREAISKYGDNLESMRTTDKWE